MIHITTVPLPESKVLQLRKWLQTEEAELYRHVLTSNIAELQVKAGQSLIEFRDQETRQDQDATEHVNEALPFVHALAILEDFRGRDNHLVSVTLSLDPPVKVPETP